MMVPIMFPCTYIQNQLFTLKSLGTARELIQDFMVNVGLIKPILTEGLFTHMVHRT